MLEIKNAIAARIVEKLKELNPDVTMDVREAASMLEYPPDSKMGDLALPCFKMSKIMRMAPVKIAATIALPDAAIRYLK